MLGLTKLMWHAGEEGRWDMLGLTKLMWQVLTLSISASASLDHANFFSLCTDDWKSQA